MRRHFLPFVLLCPCLSVLFVFAVSACSNGATTGGGSGCTQKCDGAECGPDGCGGECGACDDELACTNDSCLMGKCVYALQSMFCLAAGACVPSGTEDPANACQACTPAESQQGWSPVEDGAACGAKKTCFDGTCCDPEANCDGKECGDDGCGGACGECGEHFSCKKGRCVEEECEKECDGKECGDDGCGGVCGECTKEGYACEEGACVCKASCTGKECGPDGCGGSCGTCTGVNVVCEGGLCECAGAKCGDGCCGINQVCTDAGDCCTLKCEGLECGPDGCGGACGICSGDNVICHEGKCACPGFFCGETCCMADELCIGNSTCCEQECAGKDCGPDGCGGVCGVCKVGQICTAGKCPPPGKECDDGNLVEWDGCTDGIISEFRVNKTVADLQTRPQNVALEDGRLAVVWQSDKQDGDEWGLFAQRYKAEGGPDGFEFLVNTHLDDDQETHSVAALEGGDFVVVWESFAQDGNGDGVFGQRFMGNGVKDDVEFPVNTHTIGNQELPDVAGLHGDVGGAGTGAFVVAWSGIGAEDWGGVYAQVFAADGAKSGTQIAVNTTTQYEQKAPSVAGLPDGSYVVVWQSEAQDGNLQGVVGRLFPASGEPGPEFGVNDFWQLDQVFPTVAALAPSPALPDGGFVVVWQSDGQDSSDNGIVARVFDASASPTTPDFVVHDFTLGEQRYPSAASLLPSASFPSGGVVIAWESKGQDGSDAGVFCRIFDSTGDPAGPEFQANTYTFSNQQYPSVAASPSGTILVSWRSFDQGGENYDIFALRFDAQGNKLYQ